MAGKYPSHKYHDQKHAGDFRVLTNADLRVYFGKDPKQVHKEHQYLYSLGNKVIFGLDGEDLTAIPFRDFQNFQVEAATSLARRMAEYIIYPQRFAHDPTSVIASALMVFTHRVHRVRSGHGLPARSKRPLTKHQFGLLVKKLQDDNWLWDYAFKWAEFHQGRVKRGTCDPL